MSVILHVEDLNGVTHQVNSPLDHTVMEVLRDNNLGVQAICGGSCACATCHVIVDPANFHLLTPAGDDEQDLLSILEKPAETSRLSCQLKVTEAMHNLKLTVAPEED